MPHIAVIMIPGRGDDAKKRLAQRIQLFVADELGIAEDLISVSVQDVAMEDWHDEIRKIPAELMFVPAKPF